MTKLTASQVRVTVVAESVIMHSPADHQTKVSGCKYDSPSLHRVPCWCGWIGAWYTSAEMAEASYRRHVEQARCPICRTGKVHLHALKVGTPEPPVPSTSAEPIALPAPSAPEPPADLVEPIEPDELPEESMIDLSDLIELIEPLIEIEMPMASNS